MIAYGKSIVQLLQNESLLTFTENSALRNLVYNRLLRISEAVRNVLRLELNINKRHPEIPWVATLALGNVLRYRDETARYDRLRRARVGVSRRWDGARCIEIEGDEEIDVDAASRADEEVDAVVRIRRDVRLHAAGRRLELTRERSSFYGERSPNVQHGA